MKSISVLKISEAQRKKYQQYLDQQIISDPTDELLSIYERRILNELSYLRAEKYDSPEHQTELKALQKKNQNDKVPRNIQNPNYDQLMSYYQKLDCSITVKQGVVLIKELHQFLMSFQFVPRFQLKIAIFPDSIDPRCIQEDPQLFLCYLLTKVQTRINHENNIFNHLTNRKFDDQSVSQTIELLKETRESSPFEDYQNLADEIYQALGEPESTKYQKKNLKLTDPSDCRTLNDFLNYIYFYGLTKKK